MGAQDVLSRKTGVIVGDDVLALFKYAQEHKFAIPAIVSPHLLWEPCEIVVESVVLCCARRRESQLSELLILCHFGFDQ